MSLSFQPASCEVVKAEVASFLNEGRPLISNYFGVTDGYEYGLFSSDNTLIVEQINRQFSRLYFLSRDINNLSDILNSLDNSTFTFNVPSKNGLDLWQSLLETIPFEQYGKYYRYYNKDISHAAALLHSIANEDVLIKSEGYKLCEIADISDFKEVKELLFDTFDVYTDYLPTDLKLLNMIIEERVYVNRRPDNSICGMAAFEITGKRCYQNFWIDRDELGLYLMRELYGQMIKKDVTYTYLWVADWNKSVIKLHKMLGSVPDGMIDVTYIANKK